MFPIPSNEHLIEDKICKQCNISFPITDKDIEFYKKVSPLFAGKKYQIPTPTLCPDCRQQRRLSFRNERKLYKRKCDATGKDIISIYSPDKSYKVYNQEFWWSDKWDPMSYGKDFDFSRGFFEQFGEILKEVPKISSPNKNSTNCDYSNIAAHSKDCYLSNTVHHSENILYSGWIINSSNSVDCTRSTKIIDSYQLINCYSCSQSYYSQNCKNSNNINYSYNLDGCSYCFLCSNLSNKSYFIKNKGYSKEEYMKKIDAFLQKNTSDLVKDFSLMKEKLIHKENNNINTETCTGNNLVDCSKCYECFDAIGGEDCKYCIEAAGIEKDCMDCSYMGGGDKLTLSYDSISVVGNESHFSSGTWYNDKVIYVDFCLNSSNLFGCIGLRNKSYCILNKQYTKEEYDILVPKIIEHMMKTGEWGEFFPSSLSPFGYNETVAQEYFPLTREEALKGHPEFISGSSNGKKDEDTETSSVGQPRFNWSDYDAPFPKVEKIIPAAKLPEDITQIPDDILNWAIECEVTQKPFRIISQELEFYRKHNISIPRRHPDQRHADRMQIRNPRKLWERKCDCCEKLMITTYAPERTEIVYCESCYAKEVVG